MPDQVALTILQPHAAFNRYLQTSMLLLDACAHRELTNDAPLPEEADNGGPDNNTEDEEEDALPPLPDSLKAGSSESWKHQASTLDGALPGSAWLDASLPLHEAAVRARQHLLEDLTPDDVKQALVLYDNEERARQLAAWLQTRDGGCRRVHMVERAALQQLYPFLFYAGALSLSLPNEILPSRLYLGSAVTANATALRLLRITHVVSLLNRSMEPPSEPVRHLLLRIADAKTADMDGALLEALPFIEAALREPEGRVLVHCEAGQSRSATVVIAALMADVARIAAPAASRGMSVDEALAVVAAQRPSVRPNDGFEACLRRAAWMPTSEGNKGRR